MLPRTWRARWHAQLGAFRMTTQSILSVGPGQQFATVGGAIAAANQMGGNADIRVSAGVYLNDGGALLDGVDNVTIEGVGGLARIVDPNFLAAGGGAIVAGGKNIFLSNLDISDVTAADGNGAGVRSLAGTMVLDHVHLHNNQIGIGSGDDATGVVLIENGEIDHNGAGDGQTGNIAIGWIARLILSDSYVHDSYGGSEIESRAFENVVEDSRIYDNSSNATYSIDLPIGGNISLMRSIIEQGSNSSSSTIISWGARQHNTPSNVVRLTDNVIVNDQSSSVATLVAARGSPNTTRGPTVRPNA